MKKDLVVTEKIEKRIVGGFQPNEKENWKKEWLCFFSWKDKEKLRRMCWMAGASVGDEKRDR